MIDNYLLNGAFIGIVFGIPIGIVGLLTIQRTLAKGFTAGVISGLGSSLADVTYAGISLFGITLITDFLLRFQKAISLTGSLFIVFIGISILKSKTSQLPTNTADTDATSFVSSFLITLTNPSAILSFMVIFSTFGISGNTSFSNKILLILGIFIGTGMWWIVLAAVVKRVGTMYLDHIYMQLNKGFGTAMIVLGIMMGTYFVLGI